MKQKSKKTSLIIVLVLLIVIVVTISSFYFNKIVVADYANSDDFTIGPIVYKNNLYFVSGEKGDESKDKKLGYILDKRSPLEVILCMFFANELYTIDDSENHLIVKHDMSNSYTTSSLFENNEYTNTVFDKYSDFELLFYDENADFLIGTLDIQKDIVKSLEEQFGNVNYNIDDFCKSDKNYYIYVKSPNKGPYDLKEDSFLFIGVIMEKDSNYYYGNLNNMIAQEEAESIKTILSGKQ